MEESLQKVKNLVKENLRNKFSLDCTGKFAKTRRGLQHFLSLRLKDKDAQSLYEVVLTHASYSEKSCPGSGLVFLEKFVNDVKSPTPSLKTKQDIVDSLISSNYSKKITDILLYILNSCEENTKVSIKKSTSHHTFIEETEGYSFQANFLLKTSYSSFKDARIACIDGYVENVSELHRILTDLSENKSPCLIFCRGMSDDVLHTIKVNNDRQTILVIPFVVPFDIENVNTIVDIAVVSGTDVLSTNKGDLISSLNIQNTGKVDHVNVYNNVIAISNTCTRPRVLNHIENLKKTIEERSEIEEILSKRLRSLTASCIDVYLPDDIRFFSDSQQLDEGIRTIMSCIKNSYDPSGTASYYVKKLQTVIDNSVMCLL